MAEFYNAHSGYFIHKLFVVAGSAGISIDAYVFMSLKVMALIAMETGIDVQPVREYAFFGLMREFLERVAFEAGEFAYCLIA